MISLWPESKVIKRKRTLTFKGQLLKVQRRPNVAECKKIDIDTCPTLFRAYIGDIWENPPEPSQEPTIERRIDQLMFDIETTVDIFENSNSSIEECCEST